jgi:uncharacterized protein YjbI with pentapeptide repeats
MAWRFRLGSRREEGGGTGVQVALAPVEESASQEVTTEDASVSVSSSSTSESTATDVHEPSVTSELPEQSAVAAEAQKEESTAATEPESDTTSADASYATSDLKSLTADSSASTLNEGDAAPAVPAFPAIASDWAFEEKLAIHKEWVESQGLSGQKIDLAGAKLEGAELVGVNLRYADLQEADLKAADLLLADLRDTCLARTNLEETCLVGANLEGANMEGAALASAMGLVPRQLAGANLRDAVLPPQILEFHGLADFARASRTVVSFFSVTISLSLLSWLMILKTRDVQLISDSSIFPFLHSEGASSAFPTDEIYLIMPVVLVAIYLTLQYHLQRLWDAVLELPSIFPDGSSLDEHKPWIITGLLRAHFRWLNQDAPSTRFIEKAISMLLAYWIVPITILCFWGRYLTQQDMHGTLLHVLLFAAATGVAVYSTTRVGRPEEAWASEKKISAGILEKAKSLSLSRLSGAIVVVLFLLSLGTIKGVPHDVGRAPQFAAADIRRWGPSVFWSIGYDPYAELTEAAISTKPAGWTGADDQLASVKGARLNSARFRYAQAYGVFLANAHLFRTDFTGAFLSEADMRGADLGQSTLRLAILDRAQMAHTNLDRANLDGANMTRADLRGSNLSYSSLANATLVDAQLEGASLYSARMSGATLIRANLDKADFREAHLESANLEHAAMHQAYLWSAKLSSAKLDNAELSTAIFIDADLRSADLHGAHFQGTVLNGANLQGANLDFADMHGALGLSAAQVCSAASRNGLQLDDAMQLQVDAQCGGGIHSQLPAPPTTIAPQSAPAADAAQKSN